MGDHVVFALVVGDDSLAILQSPSSIFVTRYWQNPASCAWNGFVFLLTGKTSEIAVLITSLLLPEHTASSIETTSPVPENDVPSTR
ncbi:MAG: hypothetical protein JO031_04805 [Ktedonobacteraceae bacterium]|nr:hypothetical protein [Ktedonobacteraceae bacterium]